MECATRSSEHFESQSDLSGTDSEPALACSSGDESEFESIVASLPRRKHSGNSSVRPPTMVQQRMKTSTSSTSRHPTKQRNKENAGASRSTILSTPSRVPKPIEKVRKNHHSAEQQWDLDSCDIAHVDTAEVVNVLGELTNAVNKVVKRLDKQELQLKALQERMPSSSSSSSSESRKDPKVSALVRSETRRMYRTLLEEKEDFSGFNTENGSTFKDRHNKSVVDVLIKEVQAANPAFQAGSIRGAAYTYFRTLNQEDSLRRRGKLEDRNKARRKRERILRKMQDRNAFLEKSGISERDKQKWKVLMIDEFMSSEDSDDEDSNILLKRPIPWRSAKVTDFFNSLDKSQEVHRSGQGKRQRKERCLVDNNSSRPMPTTGAGGKKIPSWAIVLATTEPGDQ